VMVWVTVREYRFCGPPSRTCWSDVDVKTTHSRHSRTHSLTHLTHSLTHSLTPHSSLTHSLTRLTSITHLTHSLAVRGRTTSDHHDSDAGQQKPKWNNFFKRQVIGAQVPTAYPYIFDHMLDFHYVAATLPTCPTTEIQGWRPSTAS